MIFDTHTRARTDPKIYYNFGRGSGTRNGPLVTTRFGRRGVSANRQRFEHFSPSVRKRLGALRVVAWELPRVGKIIARVRLCTAAETTERTTRVPIVAEHAFRA